MRRLVPPLIVTAVILAVAVPTTCNRGAIARAKADAARLASQRDSLLSVVGERERQQAALTIQRQTHEAEISRLRDSAIALERRRATAQLSVRQIRTVGALQDRLRAAFPELGESGWGLSTLPLDGDPLGLEYLMVPAWFAETFVIDHQNAESWRAQKDQLLAVDSLQVVVIALQDSVARLVAANADAYRTGYQTAYASYQELSKRHIAELMKPRIRLGSALRLLGAAGVGVVVGRAIP